MNDAKIQFSENELNVATDIGFILTKNRIIEKVYDSFGLLSERYIKRSSGLLPFEVLSTLPKIARGENYNDLPYVMLDYPRFFSKDDVFAIRSMFWWGNDLSITLHLKGKFKTGYQHKLNRLNQYKDQAWYLQLSENEWLHHKTPQTHQKIDDFTFTTSTIQDVETGFIKIAAFYPLTQWNAATGFFEKSFTAIVEALSEKN